MEQYQEKHFVDISKHIETLLHLSVVTREAAGLIKLATKMWITMWIDLEKSIVFIRGNI